MGTAGSEDKTSDPAHPAQDNIDPFDRDFGPGQDRDSVIYQVSGMLLGYPSEELVQTLPELIRLAQATEDDEFTQAVQTVANWMTAQDLEDVQSEYVQEYDLSRRHALHLSYWTDGDTRRRGETLLKFKQMYRDSGMFTQLNGELPDYLPLVLEFAALVDRTKGRAALQAYRPSLELLRLSLKDGNLPHYGLLHSICGTLPASLPRPRSRCSRWQGTDRPLRPLVFPGTPTPASPKLILITLKPLDRSTSCTHSHLSMQPMGCLCLLASRGLLISSCGACFPTSPFLS